MPRSREFDDSTALDAAMQPASLDPAQLACTLQSTYYGLRVLGAVAQDRAALLDVAEGALTALH